MFIDYLIDNLGEYTMATEDYRFDCPFCGDSKKKLYVSTLEERKDWLHCFKCGYSSKPIKFVMEFEHVRYKEAVEALELYDYHPDQKSITYSVDDSLSVEEQLMFIMDMEGRVQDIQLERKQELFCPWLPSGYTPLISNLHNPEAYRFLAYLNSRGFTIEDIQKHGIGYVVDCYVPTSNGKSIRLQDHVVFLTFNNEGQVIYWNTRAIHKDAFTKSINAPKTEGSYSTNTVVFNLNRARFMPFIVIVEGVADAITLGDYAVCTFGKSVSDEQIDLIVNNINQEQRIYLMLDEDAKTVASKLASRILPKHPNLYIVLNPFAQDANDMGRTKSYQVIKEYSVPADETGQILRLL